MFDDNDIVQEPTYFIDDNENTLPQQSSAAANPSSSNNFDFLIPEDEEITSTSEKHQNTGTQKNIEDLLPAPMPEDESNKNDLDKVDTKRAREPRPKLDIERLLSDDGLQFLRSHAKTLKFLGKGHEARDLRKLIWFYQSWGHRLFSKYRFRDFVRKVERLCHHNRCRITLEQWYEDIRGTSNNGIVYGGEEEIPPSDSNINTHKVTNESSEVSVHSQRNRLSKLSDDKMPSLSKRRPKINQFLADDENDSEEEEQLIRRPGRYGALAQFLQRRNEKLNANNARLREDDEGEQNMETSSGHIKQRSIGKGGLFGNMPLEKGSIQTEEEMDLFGEDEKYNDTTGGARRSLLGRMRDRGGLIRSRSSSPDEAVGSELPIQTNDYMVEDRTEDSRDDLGVDMTSGLFRIPRSETYSSNGRLDRQKPDARDEVELDLPKDEGESKDIHASKLSSVLFRRKMEASSVVNGAASSDEEL
ncbi:uncharacterized protein VTP21DRAFT_8546 [Calcarisporiella thermophila]|uniref:uncharacterized protein n=1 Tax=Calcarisporiella thermophila TaxID=911321 RepID=UPI003743027C